MKKRNNLLVVFAIVAALIIGFLVGISVDYPRIKSDSVSGTIGKVENYRNVKATEADIELKNELLADTVMLKSVKNFMNFYYVQALNIGKNIDFAVAEANASEPFKSQSEKQIRNLENYGKFLETARKELLAGASACQMGKDADPVLLRSSLARANNVVAQINYRNSAVLDFITELDSFLQKDQSNKGLNKAHALLTLNEVSSSIVLRDKVLQKFFEKKKLYNSDLKNTENVNIKESIQKDMEQLKIFDAEKLGGIEIPDSEKLNMYFDAEKLGGAFSRSSETLGAGFPDSEKLGAVFPDNEKLGDAPLWNNEKLGVLWDNDKLGMVNDAENLKLW